MITIRDIALLSFALCQSSLAFGQNVDDRVVGVSAFPNYDRSPHVIFAVDVVQRGCGWPAGIVQEMSAQQRQGELTIRLVSPPSNGAICPFDATQRVVRYIIPLARLLEDGLLPATLNVVVQFVKDDGTVRSGSARFEAGPRGQAATVEPGSWDGLYGSKLQVDRDGNRLQLALSSSDIGDPEFGSIYDWPEPGFARDWIAEGESIGAYFTSTVVQLDPVLRTTASGTEVEPRPGVSTAGEIIGAIVSPTRMLISLPNGRQFEAERAAGSDDGSLVRIDSSNARGIYVSALRGAWEWVGTRNSPLSGKRLEFQTPTIRRDSGTAEWIFTFGGGGGRVYCTHLNCTVYATVLGNQLEVPLERFPVEGIGNEKLYSRDWSGAWHSIAYRAD